MYVYSTPMHKFNIPYEVDQIDSVRITYSQKDVKMVQKKTSDCILSGKTISVVLSQEETSKFTPGVKIQIQLNIKTKDGMRDVSKEFSVRCEKNQDNEVM